MAKSRIRVAKKKGTTSAELTAQTNCDNKTINIIFLILVVAFMLIIPFYRGLFFRMNYIPAIIFISIVFLFYIIYRLKDKSFMPLNTYLDLTVFAIPVSYIISLFLAANAKDAFDMLLIYSSYFILYKITSSLVRSDIKNKDIFVNTIIASTFLLSLTFVLNIFDIIKIQDIIVGKRFFGLYQYPNTTASVLGTGIILTLNMLINTEDLKLKVVYQAIFTSLIATFIFTLSRGGYLVLAAVLALNFLLINARAKLKFIISIFISFLSGSMLIYKFYTLAEDALKAIGKYYFIGLLASAIFIYIILTLKDKIKINLSDRNINIALVSLLAVSIIISGFLFTIKEPIEYRIEHEASEEKSWKNKSISITEIEPEANYTVGFNVKASLESNHSYGIIVRSYDKDNKHTEILNKFEPTGAEFAYKSYDFTTLEDTEKVLFLLYNYESDSYTVYKDVVLKDINGLTVKKMDKLKYVPEAITKRIKDISFETSSVSLRTIFAKDGLKILKDYPIAGAGGGAWKNLYRQYQSIPYNTTETHNFYVQYAVEVGIIGLIALTAVLFILAKGMIKCIADKCDYLHIYLAAMLLFMHSAIDFNLSLVAVGYILWMLVGIINSHDGISTVKKPISYTKPVILLLALSIVVFSSSIYYGIKLGGQAVDNAKENKDIDKAIKLFEKAAMFDRFNGSYRFDLAQVLNNQLRKTKDNKYYGPFKEQLAKVKELEPYNHEYSPTICSMVLAIGEFDEAAALADERILHQPMVVPPYVMKIDVNYQVAKYYLENEEIEEAVPYLERILEAERQLAEVNERIEKPLKLTGDAPKKIEAAIRTLEMIKEELENK